MGAAFVILANLPDFPLPWGNERCEVRHSLFLSAALLSRSAFLSLLGWRCVGIVRRVGCLSEPSFVG